MTDLRTKWMEILIHHFISTRGDPGDVDKEATKALGQALTALAEAASEAGPVKWGSENNGSEGSIMWSQAIGHDKAVEKWRQLFKEVGEK